MKEHKEVEDLRFVRIYTPVHIPKYLVEQVRDRDFTTEDFYKFQEGSCIRMTSDGPGLNPLNHLYVLANDENITKGFVWFSIDSLSKDICIQTFSMDKEYWGKGRAVERLAKFIKDFRIKAKLNKVYWITNYPGHSQRNGFKRSKSILMEFSEEKDGPYNDGWDVKRGEYRSPATGSATVSERDTGKPADGATSGSSLQPVLATAGI